MNLDIIKVGISVFIAIAGWITGHYFNSKRDTVANRKKLVTEYQIDAYRKLNSLACVLVNRTKGTKSLEEDIHSAVGDIQIFGTRRQIELVKEISEHLAKKGGVPGSHLNDLLVDLRNSLRTELGLDTVDFPIAHFPIEYAAPKSSSS